MSARIEAPTYREPPTIAKGRQLWATLRESRDPGKQRKLAGGTRLSWISARVEGKVWQMKAFSRIVLSMLMFAALALSQELPQPSVVTAKDQNRFVGAWRLVSIEEPGENGQVHKLDCSGMFVFTPEGKASVQLMYRNASTG